MIEDTLDPIRRALHQDIVNLHIEMLKQFHLYETKVMERLAAHEERQARLEGQLATLQGALRPAPPDPTAPRPLPPI
ncbi:hypothetical protein PAPYR_9962 [Paratrimastix pyriformis]|uniref:Uncharacterized protein n=1 Tax=Paratrimastix pyriformis TaxID=342808 RepID=A0ABQ8U9Y2_9EUKA|nr:hypothetical protein PAPYR_9962 [Paratrimastix pyriformis]